MQYLDKNGLIYYHSKLDNKYNDEKHLDPYIVGTQNEATNLWTGVAPFSTLREGQAIRYKLPVAGTSTAATLNLTLSNGQTTGAIPVLRLAGSTVTTTYAANCVLYMTYDGSNWITSAYVDSNTNTIGYQLRTNSAVYANKTGYTMNRYTLLFEVDGGLSGTATTISTKTTKTTVNFKYIPGGVIKYYSISGNIANNANFSVAGLWDEYTLNLGYTFNIGSTLVSGKPVYMRCVVNTDGTLSPNYSGSPSHPITQTLPSTADNKVYVYLGQAYSTTNIELYPSHPIYEYKDGKICLYTGTSGGSVTPVTEITSSSTHSDIPSAKAVYDLFASITDAEGVSY